MKLLTFLVDEFAWKSYSKTLEQVEDQAVDDAVAEAVVAFMHIEGKDTEAETTDRAFKKTLKHLKWLANKRELKTVVLHSFTHLGGANAEPEAARAFMTRLDERLTATGYTVKQTPFGYFCSWNISVLGESLGKVFKEF